jgi:hypothetical protein
VAAHRFARIRKRNQVPCISSLARRYGVPDNWREVVAGLDWSAEAKEEREREVKEDKEAKKERERAEKEERERAAEEPDDMDWDTEEEGEEVNIGSIAGLNGSGVHDQSAVPPPTRTNIKGKQRETE